MLDFIINVNRISNGLAATTLGLAIAREQAAFVTGLHVVPAITHANDALEALAWQEMEERGAWACDAWWREVCGQACVNGAWEVICGMYAPVLAKRSRIADLVITPWSPDATDMPVGLDDITRALFGKAAPMVLVPDHWQDEHSPAHVLIAWNGSAEATRAVRAALPLLRTARTVRVLDGERAGLAGLTPPPLPLRECLARWGVEAQWLAFGSCADSGKAILAMAHSLQCDLLVMGAWGHLRGSELLLGDTTRHVLEHASLPVLLAN